MRRWYIVTTYSGFENSVKTDLERRRVSYRMEDQVFQVLIPEETVEVIDKKGNKKQKVNKLFPGYVFVEVETQKIEKDGKVTIDMDKDVWFMIRNTPKVTGFLGSSGGGALPVPVGNDEMNGILSKLGLIVKPKIEIYPGDNVEVLSGGFAGKILTVSSVNEEKGIITTLVDLFGTTTTMEFGVEDVKKVA